MQPNIFRASIYLACVVCTQVFVTKPSVAADEPKTEVKTQSPVISFLTGDIQKLHINYGAMYHNYENETEALTRYLETNTDESPDADLRKTIAINLLGQMRATCAVDVLVENLMFLPKKDYYGRPMMVDQAHFPAADSLWRIGNTAIPALIKRIISATSKDERHLACWVLMQIDGEKLSLVRLQNFGGIPGKEKLKLTEAINYIQTFDPSTPFPEKLAEKEQTPN